MAFVLPTFNLDVLIRHVDAPGVLSDPIETVGQLKGITKFYAGGGPGGPQAAATAYLLKLPALTDIRDAGNLAFADRVELPGCTELFTVLLVWDVAMGFPNEYRCAALSRQNPGDALAWVLLPNQGRPPQP